MRLRNLAAARVRYGYRRLHVLLQREGWRVKHTRVYRLYRLEGLSLRLKTPGTLRVQRISALRVMTPAAQRPNEHWSMDFMTDSVYDGRRLRSLTLVDNVSRESPAIAADFSFSGKRVVTILERLARSHGLPKVIFVDNGPELISKALDAWAHRNSVKLAFSRPGTPPDNPCIDACNGRFRQECLDQHWFTSLDDGQTIIEAWRVEYNTVRPHSALHNRTPAEYRADWNRSRAVQAVGT